MTGRRRRRAGLVGHGVPIGALLIMAVLAVPATAGAQDAPGSVAMDRAKAVSLDKYSYLKRASLDLTGEVPSWEQLAALEGEQDVPEAVLDAMLASDGFLEVMEDYHRNLLWANVSNFQYIQFPWDLSRTAVGPQDDRHTVAYMRRRAVYYRGAEGDGENDLIPCGHWPATFDENGRPEVTCDPETGRCLEGWVWVDDPYWAPGDSVKVCAFDAHDADYGENGTFCGGFGSRREPTCGCGENLRYCDWPFDGTNVQAMVGRALTQQLLEIVRWVIKSDLPYHEMLTTRISFVNGPLVHYYKHQIQLASQLDLQPAPVEPLFLPDIPFDDERFVQVLRGPEHSGILTSYGFLLRFQTNRGRVNRFYDAFLDSYFDAGRGLPTDDCTNVGADLTNRCYCQNCHIAVEPWAAHWARWKEQGGGYLEPETYPVYDEVCETCARQGVGSCPTRCRQEYVVETVPADHEPYLGYLRGYEFIKDQHRINADAGPRLWVERTLQDGSLARGVVSKMFRHFMRRDLTESAADKAIGEELFRVFVGSNYDIKALAKAIVTLPAYRRIR